LENIKTDADAKFDEEINFDASDIEPMITYGTNPGMGLGISKSIPDSKDVVEGEETYAKSLGYMGFQQGEAMIGKQIDYVLGSCTNVLKTLELLHRL
jgi:3-isopropylmalate/(R)-2-methylmalate dehydratase large subunit